MNARLMAASAVGGFALAAIVFSPQISAQSAAAKQANGLFATLRTGQMVQLWADNLGPYIRTFEDADGKALMLHKVKEIGNDYIVLEFEDAEKTGSLFEYRLSAYHITQVVHVGKSSRHASPGIDEDKPEKKATSGDKKPAMKKKS